MLVLGLTTSCVKDLDTEPTDGNLVTAEQIYRDPKSYESVLAKCYASLSLTGQQGPTGKPDIENFDEGYSAFVRLYFYLQVVSTDEALMGSRTNGIREFVTMDWSASTPILQGIYSRLYQTIGYTNEFLRQSTPAKLASRGHSKDLELVAKVEAARVEARFIRAYCYYVICDAFGSAPFADENTTFGSSTDLPKQKTRLEIFNFVEKELLDVEKHLKDPKTQLYGRVDKAAAWFLLSRLYLNAEVYTSSKWPDVKGTARWNEAATYAEKVITSGYKLSPRYIFNFMADNNSSSEIIWPLVADGIHAKTYGGTTFFIKAQSGGGMFNFADITKAMGIQSGWGNIRVRAPFVDKFNEADVPCEPTDIYFGELKADKRALFFTIGHSKEMDALNSTYTNGYAFTKWRNSYKDGSAGKDPEFTDTDFPLFRSAEAYLIYAEAVLRGATTGTTGKALEYVNTVRNRAYESGEFGSSDVSGEIAPDRLTLDFILDERSRELSWELVRRTDLIRYNRYTGDSYVWPWKGNVKDGKGVNSKFNLFPIPASDIAANPNLTQNPDFK